MRRLAVAGYQGKRLQRWWVEKYKLPPNHPLFLERTTVSLRLEQYEDMLVRRDELLEKMKEAPDSKSKSVLLESANDIGEFFGLRAEVEDELVDKWERELEAGDVPDLDEGEE